MSAGPIARYLLLIPCAFSYGVSSSFSSETHWAFQSALPSFWLADHLCLNHCCQNPADKKGFCSCASFSSSFPVRKGSSEKFPVKQSTMEHISNRMNLNFVIMMLFSPCVYKVTHCKIN